MESEAWIDLRNPELDEVLEKVSTKLGFTPGKQKKGAPRYKEPRPSITYSFKSIWGDDCSVLEADLQYQAQVMFKMATPRSSFIYALDWHHACYKFYPSLAKKTDQWCISALPDGDYHLFFEQSFRFGWLGHPWDQTICVFGRPLLAAMKNNRPKLFRDPIRKQE